MNREEWLQARRRGIGGSDAAAVLGLSPWKSNVRLWEEKTGLREPEDISDKEVVRFGKESEAAIRRLFELDFPQHKVTYDEFGMIANEPDCPFIFATLDGELTDSDGRKGILEIKTTEIRRSLIQVCLDVVVGKFTGVRASVLLYVLLQARRAKRFAVQISELVLAVPVPTLRAPDALRLPALRVVQLIAACPISHDGTLLP